MISQRPRRFLLLTFSSLALCLGRPTPAQAATGWSCRPGASGAWACTSAENAAPSPADRPQAAQPEQAPAGKNEATGELEAAPAARSARPAWPPYPEVGDAACGPPGAAPALSTGVRHETDQPADVRSGQAYYSGADQTYTFVDDVLLQRADQELAGERLVYDEASGRVDAVGPFSYSDPGLAFNAAEGFFYLDQDRGRLQRVRYRLRSSHGHGQAETVEIENAAEARYRSVTYTTCPVGEEDWWLRASTLITDRDSGIGTAYNARLAFFGVPMLYLPYVSFPIDDRRKTGFLAPSIGSSGNDGFELVAPFYWNIAPNYDATLTPHYIADRGLRLGTEFRYLRPSFRGAMDFSYLPDDELYGDDRWSFELDQLHRFAPGLSLALDVNRVSDQDYLDDFGNDLDATSATHLESQALASWQRDRWQFVGQVQTWQTVAETLPVSSYPYRRLPRLYALYSSRPTEGGLAYSFESDLTHFAHPAEDERDTGTRLDLFPRVSLPVRRLAYFVEPALGLRYTQYQLDRAETTGSDTPSRTVPIFSVDSGIFLERDFQLGELPLRQTLEPRLFYLYVPDHDEDPVRFDSGLAGLSFGRMFSENRFTGLDRVGDANQFTVGLTTRFIGRSTGREYLRLGAAQIHYLEDREVTVTGAAPGLEEQRSSSDVLVEARSQLSRDFVAQAEYQWDPYDQRSEQGGLRLTYQPEPRSLVSATYRQRRSGPVRVVEQADLGAVWPLGQRWRMMAAWNYSLLQQTTLEQALGLEYSNCCWNLRVLGQRLLADNPVGGGDFEYDNRIMIQIEFTGLTSLGAGVEDYLRDTIYGY